MSDELNDEEYNENDDPHYWDPEYDVTYDRSEEYSPLEKKSALDKFINFIKGK